MLCPIPVGSPTRLQGLLYCIASVCAFLVVDELWFDDVLNNSESQTLTSTSRVLLVLVGGSGVALILTDMLWGYLLSQMPKADMEGIHFRQYMGARNLFCHLRRTRRPCAGRKAMVRTALFRGAFQAVERRSVISLGPLIENGELSSACAVRVDAPAR
jgi:hypothetical protein